MPQKQWIVIFCLAIRSVAIASSAAVFILFTAEPPEAGEAPQPGLWKLTAKLPLADGTSRETSRSACLTPAMLNNLAGITPSACKQSMRRDGFRLSAQFECRAPVGENKVELDLQISFDTPRHYAGTIRSTAAINGRAIAATIALEGERVAECEK